MQMLNEKILLLVVTLTFAICQMASAGNYPITEKINVFAVVSENLEQAAVDASLALHEEEGLESFPHQGYQVHCTLYMTQYPPEAREQVRERMARLAQGVRQFNISSNGLEITSGDWFFLSLTKNRNIQSLADAVTQILAPLRHPSDFIPNWAKDFPTKVEYISKYGSPNVFNEFDPHLTLTASTDGEKLKNFLANHAETYFAQRIEGKVVAIGYGIGDRNGQIETPIEIFPLQK
jgi:2'-5' RNA ligase